MSKINSMPWAQISCVSKANNRENIIGFGYESEACFLKGGESHELRNELLNLLANFNRESRKK